MNTAIPLLLVDDDEIMNFISSATLKYFQSIDVKIVLNGKQALDYLEECLQNNNSKMPTHILLDINMPIMDGFTFLQIFNQTEKLKKLSIKIAMLTTSQRDSDRENAFKFKQVTFFLQKPLTREKLNDFIK